MKHIAGSIAGIILIMLFSVTASARGIQDTTLCLEIDGKVLNSEDGEEPECYVELICDNEVRQALTLREGKRRFRFLLDKNTAYAIRISKKGFVTRIISVNTEVLTANEGIHRFSFETSLLSETLGAKLNQEVIDFPVTLIHFDYESETFTHNIEYTNYIRKELYRVKPSRSGRQGHTIPEMISASR